MNKTIAAALISFVLASTACGHGDNSSTESHNPKPERPTPKVETDTTRCHAGDVPSCDRIAEYWGSRQIVPPQEAARGVEDAKALHEACDNKNISSACMGLALMYKYGSAGKKDKAASKPYWARIAELDDLNGFRGAEPSEKGKAALAKAVAECNAGRARACDQAGWAAYTATQRDKSIPDAYASYRQGCELGSGLGCRWAGHFAYKYDDLTDLDDAEVTLRKACKLDPGGCDELGQFLETIRQTPGAATAQYAASCSGGDRAGCFHLAAAMDRARGDQVTFMGHYIESCIAGEKSACEAMAQRVTEDCKMPVAGKHTAAVAATALGLAQTFCSRDDAPAGCGRVKACAASRAAKPPPP